MCPPKALETLSTNKTPASHAEASVNDNSERSIRYRNIIELSHPTDATTPVFPGTREFERKITASHEEDRCYSAEIYLNEHTGTHMDAPAHFGPGQITVDQIAPRDLFLPVVVVDIRDATAKEHATTLRIDDLVAWEKAHGAIPDRALVCMHSGWRTRYTDAKAFINADNSGTCHFPGFHPEATTWLHEERNVVGIGVDTLSLDHGPSEDFLTHRQWCGSGHWGIENLNNLDQLPPVGAWAFIGIPKLVDGSGAPCRVLALA